MNEFLFLKFWGVRGSYPTTQRQRLGVGGNTASVEIGTPFVRLLLDAGTGIIPLGQARVRNASLPYILLLSHWHHDHLQGLPFFAPLFQATTKLTLAAPAQDENDLTEKLRAVMSPPQFPICWNETPAAKTLLALPINTTFFANPDGSLETTPRQNAVTIRIIHSNAHPSGVTLYRIEFQDIAIVYATDVEGVEPDAGEITKFARGAEVLILDAQYQRAHYFGEPPFSFATRGYGHSTPEMAADIARAARAKQLILFHHDPSYDDDTIARMQSQTRARFPHVMAAREGMSLRFARRPQEPTHVPFSAFDAAVA